MLLLILQRHYDFSKRFATESLKS